MVFLPSEVLKFDSITEISAFHVAAGLENEEDNILGLGRALIFILTFPNSTNLVLKFGNLAEISAFHVPAA